LAEKGVFFRLVLFRHSSAGDSSSGVGPFLKIMFQDVHDISGTHIHQPNPKQALRKRTPTSVGDFFQKSLTLRQHFGVIICHWVLNPPLENTYEIKKPSIITQSPSMLNRLIL